MNLSDLDLLERLQAEAREQHQQQQQHYSSHVPQAHLLHSAHTIQSAPSSARRHASPLKPSSSTPHNSSSATDAGSGSSSYSQPNSSRVSNTPNKLTTASASATPPRDPSLLPSPTIRASSSTTTTSSSTSLSRTREKDSSPAATVTSTSSSSALRHDEYKQHRFVSPTRSSETPIASGTSASHAGSSTLSPAAYGQPFSNAASPLPSTASSSTSPINSSLALTPYLNHNLTHKIQQQAIELSQQSQELMGLQRRLDEKTYEASLAPLVKRNNINEYASLKGALRKTSIDLNSSILTLQTSLNQERSKTARLVEQKAKVEASLDIVQKENQTLRFAQEKALVEQKKDRLRIEEQRKYILEFETKFGLSSVVNSEDDPLLLAKKRSAQLSQHLNTKEEELEKAKKETLKAHLVVEEQKAYIDVLKRSLSLRLQEINDHFSQNAPSAFNQSTTLTGGIETDAQRKERILAGNSSRVVLNNSTPSAGALASTPLHLTKYSLVEIAARSCKRELEAQLKIAFDRQREAEERCERISRECSAKLASSQLQIDSRVEEITRKHAKAAEKELEHARNQLAETSRQKHSELSAMHEHQVHEHQTRMETLHQSHREAIQHASEKAQSEIQRFVAEREKLLDYIEEIKRDHESKWAARETKIQSDLSRLRLENESEFARLEAEKNTWVNQAQEMEKLIESSADESAEANKQYETRIKDLQRALEMNADSHRKQVKEMTAVEEKEKQARKQLEHKLVECERQITRLTESITLEQERSKAAVAAAASFQSPQKASSMQQQQGPLSPSALQSPPAQSQVALAALAASPFPLSPAESSTHADFEARVSRARDLGSLQAKLEHFESSHANFEKLVASRERENEHLRGQLKDVQSKLDSLQTVHDSILQNQSQVGRELSRTLSLAESRLTEKDSVQNLYQSLQIAHEKLKQERKDLSKELNQLQTAYTLLQREYAGEMEKHSAALSNAHNESHLQRHELALNHAALEANHTREMEDLKNAFAEIRRALEQQNQELKENERNRSLSHAHELALLKAALDESMVMQSRLNEQKLAQEQVSEDLQTEIHNLKDQHQLSLAQQREQYEALVRSEQENVLAAEEKMSLERGNVSALQSKLHSHDEVINSLKLNITSSQQDMMRAKEELTKSNLQAEQQRNKIAHLQSQLDNYKSATSLLENQLSEYKLEVESERHALQLSLDKIQKQFAHTEQELDRMTQEFNGYKQSSVHDKQTSLAQLDSTRTELFLQSKTVQEQELKLKSLDKSHQELKRTLQELSYEHQALLSTHATAVQQLKEKEVLAQGLQSKLTQANHNLDQELSKRRGFEEGLLAATSQAAHMQIHNIPTLRNSSALFAAAAGRHSSAASANNTATTPAPPSRRAEDWGMNSFSSASSTAVTSPLRKSFHQSSTTINSSTTERYRSPAAPSPFAALDALPLPASSSSHASSSSAFSSSQYGKPHSGMSKVDERLKKIQSTFAKLKSGAL